MESFIMKKILSLIGILFAVVLLITHSSNGTIASEFKQIDFHNYPVTEDKYVQTKINKPYKATYAQTQTVSADKSNMTKKSANKKNVSKTTKTNRKKTFGTPIPDWVYENTTSSDMYYNIIHNNSIFFTNTDCTIGRAKMQQLQSALSSYGGIRSKFSMRAELKPEGSSILATCNKTYKNGICTGKKATECKCAVHYLLNNCRTNVCVINAQERRIVKIKPDETILKTKFKEISENW